MHIEIINQNLILTIHGFSGPAINKDYKGMAFKLMDKMWQIIKSKGLKHKGHNIWVYEPDEMVFAGVELEDPSSPDTGMEIKNISLTKYAKHKHVGPYHLIKQVGLSMINELKSKGLEITDPYIEIYGHWTNDETKLETELLMAVK
ncbi:MAG: GyrI-like domain-containing protein [Saprospiraceae bacterium]